MAAAVRDSGGSLPPRPSGKARLRLPRGFRPWLQHLSSVCGIFGEFGVALVGDGQIRAWNRTYRGRDYATDVLSFPSGGDCKGYLGDIAISLDTARRQAQEQGHSLETELRVLALHGLLHLAGGDHESDGGEMAAKEERFRRRLELPAGLIARTVISSGHDEASGQTGALSRLWRGAGNGSGTRRIAPGRLRRTGPRTRPRPGRGLTAQAVTGARTAIRTRPRRSTHRQRTAGEKVR